MLYRAFTETVAILKLVIPTILAGMLIANFIYSLPQFRKVNDKIVALTSFANLKSGVAVAAFFVHKITALSILAEMYKKGLIEDREVIIASIIGMFPMGVRIVMLLLAPIAISTLGLKLGMIYVFLEILSRFLVALIGVYLGKRYLIGGHINYTSEVSLKNSTFDVFKQFFRVLVILVPGIFIVTLLLDIGFNSFISSLNKSPQIIIIAAGTSSTIAGLGVAGSLLAKGEVDGKVALISLIIASAFHRVVESLRHSMPINVSLFGHSFGLRLTVILLLTSELALLFTTVGLLVILF